jgi:beta-glucanase (GH16 family)
MILLRLVTAAALLITLSPAPETKWKLTWSDEFNGPDGSAPDSAKWNYDLGGKRANHELESYTNRPENVRMEDGHLVIEARREDYTGPDGIHTDYTSGRIKTLGLFTQQYGRFEARIRIPRGQGTWPAFWMMGDDIATHRWPSCGEIDVMENIGREPGRLYATLHGPGFEGKSKLQSRFDVPAGEALADAYHVYAVDWSREAMTFSIDGKPYGTIVRDTPEHGSTLPMDHPYFLLLNLAVGGDWPGNPDATSQFPMRMLVDYVRVYKRES